MTSGSEWTRVLCADIGEAPANRSAAVGPGQVLDFSARWANAGVAPMYQDAYPAVTLKDACGGIATVLVDEGTDLRRVLPACLGESSPRRYEQESVFRLADARRCRSTAGVASHGIKTEDLEDHGQRAGHLWPGEYWLFIRVGSRQGTPRNTVDWALSAFWRRTPAARRTTAGVRGEKGETAL